MKTAALVLVALLPTPLAAQGLGDAAAKERQKRQQQAKPAPAKVFTDSDLSSRGAPSPPGDEGSADAVIPRDPGLPGPEGSATPASPATPDQLVDPSEKERQERKLLEAEWRVRFANAREQVALAEAACWQEVVRTQFYQGLPVQMKVKEFVESEELRRAKKALADLEEEFRRTGLPPGWARES
jgi:hypothetical protein